MGTDTLVCAGSRNDSDRKPSTIAEYARDIWKIKPTVIARCRVSIRCEIGEGNVLVGWGSTVTGDT